MLTQQRNCHAYGHILPYIYSTYFLAVLLAVIYGFSVFTFSFLANFAYKGEGLENDPSFHWPTAVEFLRTKLLRKRCVFTQLRIKLLFASSLPLEMTSA